MTLLDDRPTTEPFTAPIVRSTASASGTTRFALRLARRESRRRPGRTALAALLIAVPVAAMTLGSAVIRTYDRSDEPSVTFATTYGTADVARDPWLHATAAGDPDTVAPEFPAGTRALDYLWAYGPVQMSGRADVEFATVTDIPLADPMLAGVVDVLDGDLPAVGEVMIGDDLADAWGLSVGDELRLDRPSGTWTISGIVRYRSDHWTQLVVIPGFDRDRVVDGARRLVELWDVPDTTDAADVQAMAIGVQGISRYDVADPWSDRNATPALAWGWVAGALALVAVGIIVAAAFATTARRQLVTVGQLLSNGATERTVRRSLALQGSWTAAVGAAVGLIVGLAALPLGRGLLEGILKRDLTSWQIAGGDLLVIAVTATIVGTVAAAVPARSAARVPVMSALAGHRPVGAPPRRLVPVGLALVAGGLFTIVVGASGASTQRVSSHLWPALIVLGSVGVVFGMVCATPLVVDRIGVLGRRAPLAWRLGLRSLARARTRSAAVVAAIAVAVGGSVALAAAVEHSIETDGVLSLPMMPADAAVVSLWDEFPCCEGVIDASPLESAALPADLAEQIRKIVPGATSSPLVVATYDPPRIDWASYSGPYPETQGPLVATEPMLDLLGLDASIVETLRRDGSVFVQTTPDGDQWTVGDDTFVTEYPTVDGPIAVVSTVVTALPHYSWALNRPIVTPEYAEAIGFELVERGEIVRGQSALTDARRSALRDVFQAGDLGATTFVEPGDAPLAEPQSDSLWQVSYDDPSWRQGNDVWLARLVMTGIALALSALVVAIGLALAAAEGREERNVLLAVGARPASMRRQAAARAAVLALTGIALGIPTGFVPAWVLVRFLGGDVNGSEPLGFPWLVVAVVTVVIPIVVAAMAWIGSGIAQRTRPPRISRQD